MDLPKGLKVAKGFGVLTVGLTAISVADDFKNNKTMPEKLEASGVDVAMTGAAYGVGTGLIAGVAAVGTVLAAPEIVVGAATIATVVGVAYAANWATGAIKKAWHLW